MSAPRLARFSAEARVVAALAMGVSLIAAGGALTAWSIARLEDSSTWVAHTMEVLQHSQEVLQQVAEIEASGRGFLLTEEAEQRERLRAAGDELSVYLEHVRALVADNPQQVADWTRVEALSTERLALAEQVVALHLADPAAAVALVRSGRGAALTRMIEEAVGTFQRDEQVLLAARQAEQRAAVRRSFVANGTTALGGMLLVGLAGWVAVRETRRRARAAADLRRAMDTLHETTAERDRFFSLSLDVMVIANAGGHFTFISPAATSLLGWSVDELTSRPFLDFVHPDDHAATLREVDRQVRAGEPVLHFENRYRHKDGTWRVLSWKSAADPDGTMYAIARDVTAQRAAEADHRTASERLELATRGAGIGVFEWDVINDRATWDATSGALLGRGARQGEGTHAGWLALVHPDDRARANGELQAAVRGERPFEMELRIVWPDGTVHYLQTVGSLRRDDAGRARCLLGVIWDITERKRLTRELQLILDTSAEGLYGIGLDGHCTFMNTVGARLLGYAPAEVVGQHNHLLFHHHRADGTELPLDECLIYRAMRAGEPAHVDSEVFWRKDGSSFPVEYRAVPKIDDGRVRGVVVSFNDITERTRARAALVAAKAAADEANRAKSQFLANMSHELRTPLNAIIGFSEMLEDGTPGPLNEKQTRYAANITASGRHLLVLINDILDLSKVEAGRLDLRVERLALERIVGDALAIVRSLAEKKRISLRAEVAHDLPALSADAGKVKQVLYNLLSNAVKFTPEGGTVAVAATAGDGRMRVAVSDTGIGIRPADHERVWREFEQVDSGYARAQQGTGLGLALTRRIVELHGGRIWLESDGVAGHGSVFTFELPLAGPPQAQTSAPAQPSPAQEDTEPPSGGSGRALVLVVEDDEQAIRIMDEFLRGGGYEVAHARTAEQGLDMARRLKPIAITLDIILPDRSGWELVRDLKTEPVTRDVPIVVVSVTDDRRLAESLGVADFLVKPVGRARLIEALARAIAGGRR